MKRHYIREEKPDGPSIVEQAYYGPFAPEEMEERLNDAFADLLAEGLANIDEVVLSDEEAAEIYINPREFWMDQLASLSR